MGFSFWAKKAPPPLTHEYQESVAHKVRDILTGQDQSNAHSHRNKTAIKALQRPEALAGVIEILKTMPEPCPRADGWETDEGLGLDDSEEEIEGHDTNPYKTKASQASKNVSMGVLAQKAESAPALVTGPGQVKAVNAPDGKLIVAATTIAAAATTAAAASTLALTVGRRRGAKLKSEQDKTKSTTITKTTVKFKPAKETVSSHAYWWGYEIFIPEEALSRIGSAQDVSTAFLTFLGSVGLVVPAIVPFLGYIAAYVGLEFAVIKAQNEGKGVILASTWLVPVALVPRAWDVPEEEDDEEFVEETHVVEE
ncbi:hypothetical protein BGW38_000103 [Lunasporangiospora selenospora]|uniref:Uncharacterized protein n=1 Tax=Lunasporangiospora selenospora TaxID=979761 RepID=A0A9P6FWM6_9FUNG|nr:hypothetical protein BGW38_000103 [Lunasporangiospora selenospora]